MRADFAVGAALFLLYRTAPGCMFQKRSSCNRTFIRLVLFLLYCFCFTAGLFVFLRSHFMVR